MLNNHFSQQISILCMPFPQRKRLSGWTILKCSYSVLCGYAELRHMDGVIFGSDRPDHLKTCYSWGLEFFFLCCYAALAVLLLVNKQVQLPTQQKSNMDKRVDALYDWAESPQGQTPLQEIESEDRTALGCRTRSHGACCSIHHWCHVICLFHSKLLCFLLSLGSTRQQAKQS